MLNFDFLEKGLGIVSQNPFPTDHFKINNKNDNPKSFMLFSA